MQMIVQLTNELQWRLLSQQKLTCDHWMNTTESNFTGTHCSRIWDGVMCWPDTPAGAEAYQPCPTYINGFDTEETATRLCLSNGTWFPNPLANGSSSGWTNYTACYARSSLDLNTYPDIDLGVAKIVLEHIREFRLMYNIGYGLSLVCLLLAVTIIASFRKLHCHRNMIHLNLFLSFILRAAMSTIKENLLVQNIGFAGDVGYVDNTTLYFKEGSHWECRLFFSAFQYTIVASYIWIFVEGLYLHMLIFVSVFTEKSRITGYIVFGWTFPVPFVVAWVISRTSIDNTLCWNTSTNSTGLIWILKGPVMLSIILNFIFFISIVRVLFTKLTSSHCPDSKKQRYRRLARSTLVLIPIFGVYYIVFTIPVDRLDDQTSFIMLCIEMFFNSYQGVIIAFLLCFANAEVRSEIQKAWNRHRLRRSSTSSGIQSQYRAYRSSSDGRGSDPNPFGSFRKKSRRSLKKNTSATCLEETYPFGIDNRLYDTVQNGNIELSENNEVTINEESSDTFERSVDEICLSDAASPVTFERIVIKNKSDSDIRDGNIEKTASEIALKINILTIQYRSRSDDKMHRNVSTVDIETLQNGATIKETSFTSTGEFPEECADETVNVSPDNETFFLIT